MKRPSAGRDGLREAGELLGLEAVDRTGLAVTSEGAFVRVLEVTPPNPLILSGAERERTAEAFCYVVGRLRPGQSLQFYVEARPVNLAEVLEASRREVAAWAGPAPEPGRVGGDPLALSRWRLEGAMEESLTLHADDQAAVRLRSFVVVPLTPSIPGARAVLSELRPGRGSGITLSRPLSAHRRAARESLAQTDAIRGELEALGLPTRLLNGAELVALLWARFNPTRADAGQGPAARHVEILGELDAKADAEDARRAAERLRGVIAASSLDFSKSRHHAQVDRDLEQVLYAATTADATSMGWLMGAMLTRQPFALSVFVHALDRRRERQRLKMAYRRVFAVNRGAESRGRVPDFDRYAQEHESERLLAEMAGHDRANLFRVSIYQALRARGPEPDPAALAEAVDFCAEQIESASDCRVSRGDFQQEELWASTLPLGRDHAGRARKYATRNVGDTVPLLGTSCGSPEGIPFAFSEPGRTLELLNPYDRTHANQTLLVAGRSGSGKTLTCNVILARCLAHGAHAFVLDRAGHYEGLVRLVAGARQIEIGADDAVQALNPWDVPDPTSVSQEKISFLLALHAVMLGEEGLSGLERSHLGAAIRTVYARAAGLGVAPRESLLRDELLARAEEERRVGDAAAATLLRNLAERLSEFCADGVYAYLLDRETTVDLDAPLVVFETRRVPEAVLRPVVFSIMEHVTRQVERRRELHRELAAGPDAPLMAGRTAFMLDEAWAIVGRRETGAYANDLARRARHLGLFLLVSSQAMSDFDTEHGVALIRNSTMHVLLAQHPDEVPFVKEALKLSDQESALLSRLKTVKGSHAQMFWVNGTRGKGQVSLRIGPTEYWAFTTDPLRDVPLRDQALARHDGDIWAALAELAHGPQA